MGESDPYFNGLGSGLGFPTGGIRLNCEAEPHRVKAQAHALFLPPALAPIRCG